jgi:large subunit ribosomal protein L13
MLPKNRLGRALFKNMYVYVGATHPHEAQKPRKIEVKNN